MSVASRPSLAELIDLGEQARQGDVGPTLGEPIDEAVAVIGAALGTFELDVVQTAGSMTFKGWFSRASALIASQVGAGEASDLKVAILSIERLAARLAQLVDLGPRPDLLEPGQMLVPSEVLQRIVLGDVSRDPAGAATLLGIPDGALRGWASGLGSSSLVRWKLSVEASGSEGAVPPRQTLEVLDAPGSRCWIVLGQTDDGETLLSAATPRLIWIALTSIVPCWDSTRSLSDSPPLRASGS